MLHHLEKQSHAALKKVAEEHDEADAEDDGTGQQGVLDDAHVLIIPATA